MAKKQMRPATKTKVRKRKVKRTKHPFDSQDHQLLLQIVNNKLGIPRI
jgi:hypothetical protein